MIALSEIGLFDLPFEHNQSLAQHRVFNDKISAAAGRIGEEAGAGHTGSRFGPLFEGLF